MLFASIEFILFIILFVLVYFLTPSRYKWATVVLGSIYFYVSLRPVFVFLIFFSILFNYLFGKLISDNAKERKQTAKLWALIGIVANLLFLIVFKYAYFLTSSLNDVFGFVRLSLSVPEILILLPLGISFYTFQNISYLVDLYQGRYLYEKHLGVFAAYTLFFPKLISGPIERPSTFLPQVRADHRFNPDDVIAGSKRIVWGLFKKLVVADRLGVLVDVIYNNPTNYNSPYLIVATIFFCFQLYADFSGYSDIAIGTARILGYKLTENFRRPYLSKSVSEFWRRWHISLSSWFQDYVFIPLYLRISKLKRLQHASQKTKHAIAFTISIIIGETLLGIWHGANWTFVAFGLYYGIVISFYYFVRTRWDAMNAYIQMILTFILVNIGWVFFRANTLSDAFYILQQMTIDFSLSISQKSIGFGYADLFFSLVGIGLIIIYDFLEERGTVSAIAQKLPLVVKAFIWMLLILIILMLGVYTYSQFIYFQF